MTNRVKYVIATVVAAIFLISYISMSGNDEKNSSQDNATVSSSESSVQETSEISASNSTEITPSANPKETASGNQDGSVSTTNSEVSKTTSPNAENPSVIVSEVDTPNSTEVASQKPTERPKSNKTKETAALNSATDPPKISKSSENSKTTLGSLTVSFIDVGQADAALLEVRDKNAAYNVLIDSGDWTGNQTLNFLHQKGIKHINVAVGTHPHADHIGQLDKIINSDIKVDELWMNGDKTTSKVFERVISAASSHGLKYEEPRAGDSYTLGNLKIKVLHPSHLTKDLNNDSIVLLIQYGKVSFLFTGDVESDGESSILSNSENIHANILKVGHHGSKTSSTKAFINAVDPDVAVISYALKSKYNHPNGVTLDTLNAAGVKIYGTGANGTVIVTTDGAHYKVNTEKSGTVVAGDR